MPDPLQFADSRALGEPFAQQLSQQPPDGALAWLGAILATQAPALRSSNATLLAYTGNPAAIAWINTNIGSPVAGQWGVAAALLGTPWPQIADWLQRGGAHRLMALDALLAYRKPAVNMSPLEQIAAPVLPQAPARAELDAALAACLASSGPYFLDVRVHGAENCFPMMAPGAGHHEVTLSKGKVYKER